MQKILPIIRGLINDLTRTLTASLIHIDDLLLEFDEDLEAYDHAWLANQQLGRAIEFFIELRTELLTWQKYANCDNKAPIFQDTSHFYSNKLTSIMSICDLLYNQNRSKSIRDMIVTIKEICGKSPFNIYINNRENSAIKLAEDNFNLGSPKTTGNMLLGKPKSIKRKRILLVEDDDDVRKFISLALAQKNYTVFDSSDGGRALEIFKKENAKFDLCFIDIVLPDIDGYELVNKIFKLTKNVKVLFTSGYGEEALPYYSKINETYPILKKPYSLNDLYRVINQLIET